MITTPLKSFFQKNLPHVIILLIATSHINATAGNSNKCLKVLAMLRPHLIILITIKQPKSSRNDIKTGRVRFGAAVWAPPIQRWTFRRWTFGRRDYLAPELFI